MMKKRLLMPFLVASLMVASVAALDSCDKKQEAAIDPIFTSGEAPLVDIVYSGDRAGVTCPYCGQHVGPGVSDHWHAFGTPPEGSIYTGPTPWPVDWCSQAGALVDDNTCPYSGNLHDDEEMIAYYMSRFGIDREAAQERLLPRFHAHRIQVEYDGGNGGSANHWHVGGDVPWWPILP